MEEEQLAEPKVVYKEEGRVLHFVVVYAVVVCAVVVCAVVVFCLHYNYDLEEEMMFLIGRD